MRWTENRLNVHHVISGLKSSWRPVSSGVLQGWLLLAILFNLFANELDDESKHTLNEFADDTKVRGMADAPDECATVQRALNSLKKWRTGLS